VKILVIDDHPLIREALRHVLLALDQAIELLEAQDLPEALATAGSHPDVTLILLDLALPGTDGFEALRELRERYPAIPVVVLSASDQPETVREALDLGAMGFIPKTSSNEILIGALRLVLSGGVYLPPEVLRKDAGGTSPDSTVHPRPSGELRSPREIGLTQRQTEVLALLIQGKPNKLICRQLDLAEGTVKIHVTAILKALGVTNRTQAVIAVSKLGLKLPAV
jgi:DNA-binding NarL/FixJ family response regulator